MTNVSKAGRRLLYSELCNSRDLVLSIRVFCKEDKIDNFVQDRH